MDELLLQSQYMISYYDHLSDRELARKLNDYFFAINPKDFDRASWELYRQDTFSLFLEFVREMRMTSWLLGDASLSVVA